MSENPIFGNLMKQMNPEEMHNAMAKDESSNGPKKESKKEPKNETKKEPRELSKEEKKAKLRAKIQEKKNNR